MEFGPAYPCAMLCPSWQVASALGYRPCENPTPLGAYADVVTEPAPVAPEGYGVFLVFETNPYLDWDTWICSLLSNGSHNGGEIAQGANLSDQVCGWSPSIPPNPTGVDGTVAVGCRDVARAQAEPGRRYVLRAYNWVDVPYLAGRYSWEFVAN